MYAQTLRFSSHIAPNPPLKQQNGPFSPKSGLGFSKPSKRVCNPIISCRKTCHLAAIRCSGSQEVQEVTQEGELDDGYYMRRCVEIARKAIGCTSPNPMVGCVIVKDGKIVGEGFHPKAGQPHAEVFALRDAGDLAENATAYVSLEPCNHYGRTPPCTEALIKANVKKVVVGMVDPNPIVASMGVKRLQDAGIEVTVAVEEQMCKRLNEAYIHHILTKTPFVTLRYSMSLDGNILNQLGEEAMEYGGYYSKLLQEYDALIISDTALPENSSFLMSKEPGAKQPLKILLSKTSASKVTQISEEDTIVEPQTCQEEILTLSLDRTNLTEILEHCKKRGVCSVLIDLRGNNQDFEDILKEGFEQNLFQKVVVEVLPVFGSGPERTPKFMDLNVNCKKLVPSVCRKGVLLEGYF